MRMRWDLVILIRTINIIRWVVAISQLAVVECMGILLVARAKKESTVMQLRVLRRSIQVKMSDLLREENWLMELNLM
jgi:hypothetical protein